MAVKGSFFDGKKADIFSVALFFQILNVFVVKSDIIDWHFCGFLSIFFPTMGDARPKGKGGLSFDISLIYLKGNLPLDTLCFAAIYQKTHIF